MEATRQGRRTGARGRTHGPEPRVVAIEFRPAPDAEERLRRIAALLLQHAAHSPRQAAAGEEPEGG